MNEFLQDLLSFIPQPWRSLTVPLGVFVLVVLAGLAARRIAFAKLRRWVGKTPSQVDDVIIEALHGPALLWAVILAISAAATISELPPRVADLSGRTLLILWILSLTIAATRLAGRLVRLHSVRDGAPAGTLSEVIASLVVGSLGVLTLLRALGIDITPYLTALGVGGLAVALALQDTLSNLFAGFYISVAGQIRVGDLIQLETGQRGYVTDIGWRATTLRDTGNNLVVIPNNKLGQSTVTNYHLPQRKVPVSIQVGVSYETNPDHVERVLLEIARASDIAGLLHDPPPVVLLSPGFGDRALEFTLVCHLADFEDQGRVQDHIRRRILKRFAEEGIVMPYIGRVEPPPPPPSIQ